MQPTEIVDDPPPLPPKSLLRNSARLSTASVHSIQDRAGEDLNSSTYASLSQSIDNLVEHIRPRDGLKRTDTDSLRLSHSISRSSYSSTYSLELASFPVPPSTTRPNTSHQQQSPQHLTSHQPLPLFSKSPTSSASLTSPTSSRPSYSSSRPVSPASTHTAYSNTAIPRDDEKTPLLGIKTCSLSSLITPIQVNSLHAPILSTHPPIFAMIEQLSPIIYQESTWPLTEPTYSHSHSLSDPTMYGDAYVHAYTLVDKDLDPAPHSHFPPHPCVRPLAPRKQSYTSIASTGPRKHSIGAMLPVVATSLMRLGRRRWRS